MHHKCLSACSRRSDSKCVEHHDGPKPEDEIVSLRKELADAKTAIAELQKGQIKLSTIIDDLRKPQIAPAPQPIVIKTQEQPSIRGDMRV